MIYDPMPIGRVCRVCKLWKPRAELKKRKAQPDGVDMLCLICHCEQSKKRYIEKKEEILVYQHQYRLDHLDEVHEYDRQRRATPERQQYMEKYSAQYYQENRQYLDTEHKRYLEDHPEVREKMKKIAQRWSDANRDKVREIKQRAQQVRQMRKAGLPATFTADDRRYCLMYWRDRCAICGRPAGLWHTLAMDHWIPVTKYGAYVPTNILPLCHGVGGCNNSKNNREPVEWLISCLGPKRAQAKLAEITAYFASIT